MVNTSKVNLKLLELATHFTVRQTELKFCELYNIISISQVEMQQILTICDPSPAKAPAF